MGRCAMGTHGGSVNKTKLDCPPRILSFGSFHGRSADKPRSDLSGILDIPEKSEMDC